MKAWKAAVAEILAKNREEVSKLASERGLAGLEGAEDIVSEAYLIRDTVLPAMAGLRVPCDDAEILVGKTYWPFPTYGDILFSVR